MVAPADPALGAAGSPATARLPDLGRPAGPAIASRFGEISPAFAAAYGASVDVGLMLGSRNAQARSFASAARGPRGASRHATLPLEITTARALPASRVRTAVGIAPRR